jgi:D-alanine-D-alanine ligase
MVLGYLDRSALAVEAVPTESRAFVYDFAHLPAYLEVLRERMHIAVVYGGDKRSDGAVIRATHNTRPWKSYRVVAEDIAGALRELGFAHVVTLPDDRSLAAELERHKIDLVWLNTGGVQGYNPVSHTPAMLEMLGVPYVGQNSLTASILDNKHVFKRVLGALGIRTAPSFAWHPAWGAADPTRDDRFAAAFGAYRGPFILKPVSGRASVLVLTAETVDEVAARAAQIHEETQNTVLIEPFLGGREYCVSVCGPVVQAAGSLVRLEAPFAFSAVERVFVDGETIFTSMDVKPISADRVRLLDGEDDRPVREELLELARQIYRNLELESIVRVDVRADAEGNLYVLEVNPKPDLKKPTADVTSLVTTGLAEHGLDYQALVLSLLADRLDNLLHYHPGDVDHLIAQLPRFEKAA